MSYYDRYSNGSHNQWRQLRFNPDRPVQSAELNELGSILLRKLIQLGNSYLNQGALLTNPNPVVSGLGPYTVSLSASLAFINGLVWDVPSGSVSLAGTGTDLAPEVVGLLGTSDFDTNISDPTLNDPATGTPAFNLSG